MKVVLTLERTLQVVQTPEAQICARNSTLYAMSSAHVMGSVHGSSLNLQKWWFASNFNAAVVWESPLRHLFIYPHPPPFFLLPGIHSGRAMRRWPRSLLLLPSTSSHNHHPIRRRRRRRWCSNRLSRSRGNCIWLSCCLFPQHSAPLNMTMLVGSLGICRAERKPT